MPYVRIGELDYSLDSPGSIGLAYEALDAIVRSTQCGKRYLAAHASPGELRKSAPSLASIETRLAALERARGEDALRTMKASLRQSVGKRAPALRPDVARIIAKAQAAGATLDAALAKCAERDALKYTPPSHRGAP